MLLDPTYKAMPIEESDSEDIKTTKILLRVCAYLAMSAQMLMSGETQKRILGDDGYAELALDTVCYNLEHTTEETEKYIRFNLAEGYIPKPLEWQG